MTRGMRAAALQMCLAGWWRGEAAGVCPFQKSLLPAGRSLLLQGHLGSPTEIPGSMGGGRKEQQLHGNWDTYVCSPLSHHQSYCPSHRLYVLPPT